jgi:hypothetical protein
LKAKQAAANEPEIFFLQVLGLEPHTYGTVGGLASNLTLFFSIGICVHSICVKQKV